MVAFWLYLPYRLVMDDAMRAAFPNVERLLQAVYTHPTSRQILKVRRLEV